MNEFLADIEKHSRAAKLEDSLFEEFRLYGMPLPERQYKFHPIRKWRADFAWPALKILVEVQGGLYGGGRHNQGAAMEKEYEKLNEATRLGWRVYLFGPAACRVPKKVAGASKAAGFMYDILVDWGTQAQKALVNKTATSFGVVLDEKAAGGQ